jgi:predicted Fe-S protein YdhL (DUF1289 family)
MIDEIMEWGQATDDRKRAILAAVEARRSFPFALRGPL